MPSMNGPGVGSVRHRPAAGSSRAPGGGTAGPTSDLLGATPDGEVFFLAQSEHGADAEFCGLGISPDERMLFVFVDVQGPGTAFVVQGPFRRLT
jgi:secreted PhoX family phosphatase